MPANHTVSFEPYQLPLRSQSTPKDGEVDLWLWSRDNVAGGLFPVAADGPPSDRRTRVRARRMSGRFMLRMVLAAYLGLPAREVKIDRDQRGKPHLVERPADCTFSFNTSHTGPWQLLAISAGAVPGVDLELLRHGHDGAAVARRYFDLAEQEALLALPMDQRRLAFFRAWTRKEAVLKALGCGLAGNIDQVVVNVDPLAPGKVLADHVSKQRWQLVDLEPARGLLGTLAVAGDVAPVVNARHIQPLNRNV